MKLISVTIILLSLVCKAIDKPSWVTETPKDTSVLLYFVGRSSNVDSEAEGLRMASKDAKEQLLRQEFGTSIKVDTTQSETLKDISLDSKLSEISDLILLKGFKQVKMYTEKTDKGILVSALFSVPISDLKEEKKRIVELRKQKAHFDNKPEVASVEYDNGGKPKLRKAMKKSEVIKLFGVPKKVEDSVGHINFSYDSSEFCEEQTGFGSGYFSCYVWFDESGKVDHWYKFKPGYTTDLDDEPVVKKIKKTLSVVERVPKWKDTVPVGAIPADKFISFDKRVNNNDIPVNKMQECDGGGNPERCNEEIKRLQLPEVRKIFQKACDHGDLVSCSSLGRSYSWDQNYSKAESLFKKVCDSKPMWVKESGRGCYYWGQLKLGLGLRKEAKNYFQRACEMGFFTSCGDIGSLESNDGNDSKARLFYKKGCDGDDFGSCSLLGHIEKKLGNKSEAKRLFNKVCNHADPNSTAYITVCPFEEL